MIRALFTSSDGTERDIEVGNTTTQIRPDTLNFYIPQGQVLASPSLLFIRCALLYFVFSFFQPIHPPFLCCVVFSPQYNVQVSALRGLPGPSRSLAITGGFFPLLFSCHAIIRLACSLNAPRRDGWQSGVVTDPTTITPMVGWARGQLSASLWEAPRPWL